MKKAMLLVFLAIGLSAAAQKTAKPHNSASLPQPSDSEIKKADTGKIPWILYFDDDGINALLEAVNKSNAAHDALVRPLMDNIMAQLREDKKYKDSIAGIVPLPHDSTGKK